MQEHGRTPNWTSVSVLISNIFSSPKGSSTYCITDKAISIYFKSLVCPSPNMLDPGSTASPWCPVSQGTKGLDYFERSQFHHYGGGRPGGRPGGRSTSFSGFLELLKPRKWEAFFFFSMLYSIFLNIRSTRNANVGGKLDRLFISF